jgi:ferrous iron transport protein B
MNQNNKKIVLAGNPNSGKSAIFTRLTSIEAISSNYPGTTVEITKGTLKISNDQYEIIDAPGIYSLSSYSKAEEVANKTIEEADIIINIIDSTNLERSLNLTLQLLNKKKPLILVLNFWDETKHNGIEIDIKKIESIFNVPVVTTCAITGQGIKYLVEKIKEAKISNYKYDETKKWEHIGDIIEQVQKIHFKHHLFSERLNELSVHPFSGIIIAIFILFISFIIIRFIGEGIINYLLDPLFNKIYMPLINKLYNSSLPLFLKDLLIGKTPEVMKSFGIITTGIYVPLVVVLPYIFSFYLVLSILEDTGYLPRLSVMFDSILHKFGIHGYSSIPIILGLGCKVPALFSIRILESEREKVITAILVLLSAPCMPQTAMILSLGMPYGLKTVVLIFAIVFFVSIITSFLLNKTLKGEAQELFLEIPPYRIPAINILFKKLWIRLKSFLFEAVPLIFFGIFLINLMEISGIINFLSEMTGGFFHNLFGMPEDMGVVLLLGFLRKDVSISMLAPFTLTSKQFIIASIFLVIYLPCIASFFTLLKEFGKKITFKIIGLNFFIAFLIAFLLNFIL